MNNLNNIDWLAFVVLGRVLSTSLHPELLVSTGKGDFTPGAGLSEDAVLKICYYLTVESLDECEHWVKAISLSPNAIHEIVQPLKDQYEKLSRPSSASSTL